MNSVQNQTTPGIQPQQTAQSAKPAPAYSMQQPQIPAYASPQAPMPNYAGVNIQIYNPSVGVPNLNPSGTAPNNGAFPGNAYPSNYYTNQWGPQSQSQTLNQSPQQAQPQQPQQNITALSTPPAKPQASSATEKKDETKSEKKTEKRKIVELTDDYIRNLENYLNSQDKEVRMMGAKEVVARLQEDESRKDDPALTALINKMLQDPSQQIRILALSMLDARIVTGDDYTVNVLKNMQHSTEGYGQDANQATNILLKMSGKTVEKEFEVKDNSKSDSKK